MHVYTLRLFAGCDIESLWEALTIHGFSVLYSEEIEDPILPYRLYLAAEGISLENLQAFCQTQPSISSISYEQLPDIDWEEQWQIHAHGFNNGILLLDLSTYQPTLSFPPIQLIPGPGFGDLSHPTTRIMLQLLTTLPLHSCSVVDIGSGSGILTLAAAYLQLPPILGIDCDPAALAHAANNSNLNGLDQVIRWKLPEEVSGNEVSQPILLLMNMISSEQEVAWSSLPDSFKQARCFISSGVPVAERENYCRLWKQRGWKIVEEKEEDGWLGWIWTK